MWRTVNRTLNIGFQQIYWDCKDTFLPPIVYPRRELQIQWSLFIVPGQAYPLHGFGYCAHHLKLKSVTLVANIRYITWLSVAYVTGELRILTREEAKKRRVKIWHLYEPKEDNKIELSIHMKITKKLLLNLKKKFWLKLKTTFFMIHFSIHFHALIIWAFKTWDCSSVICLSINGITSLLPSPFSFGLFTVRQKLQNFKEAWHISVSYSVHVLFVSDLPLATAFDRRKMLLYSAYFCLACFGVVHTHTFCRSTQSSRNKFWTQIVRCP